MVEGDGLYSARHNWTRAALSAACASRLELAEASDEELNKRSPTFPKTREKVFRR